MEIKLNKLAFSSNRTKLFQRFSYALAVPRIRTTVKLSERYMFQQLTELYDCYVILKLN